MPLTGTKPLLMPYGTMTNRLIVLAFMFLVGFSIANAISSHSITGMLLAGISLLAGIYFLHLLAKMKRESESEEAA